HQLGTAGVFALGLCACQVLPSLELVGLTSRAGGLSGANAYAWSVPPARLFELLAPGLFGCVAERTSWLVLLAPDRFPQLHPYVLGAYFGVPFLAVAAAGVAGAARRSSWLLCSAAVLLLLMALGDATPLLPAVRACLPGAGFLRYPEKLLTVAAIPLALLVGAGMESLQRPRASDVRAAGAVSLLLLVISGTLALLWILQREPVVDWLAERIQAQRLTLDATLLWEHGLVAVLRGLVPAVFAAVLLSPPVRKHAPKLVVGALALGIPCDLVLANRSLVRVDPVTTLTTPQVRLPDPGAFVGPRGRVRVATGIAARGVPMVPHQSSLLGYHTADCYGGLPLAHWHTLREALQGSRELWYTLSSVWLALYESDRGDAYSSGAPRESELLGSLSRAELVPRATWAPDDAAASWRLRQPDFDPRREVVLDGAPPADAPLRHESGEVPPGRVRVAEESEATLKFLVEAHSASYLLVTDAWYPGWEARVDGDRAALYRANILFRAVPVPAGSHTVELTFQPASVRLGIAISLATLLVGVVTLFFAARSHSRRRQSAP
ncbi:YfhO family protein, partial [Planctomycetota bacterium]